MKTAVIVLILIFTITQCWCQTVNVTISQGVLIGAEKVDRNGSTYYSFQSIPYALPPVGELRFKEPQDPDSWSEPRDATEDLPSCYQLNEAEIVVGDEDCLYLNVYTPEVPTEGQNVSLRDVMVFIHGGGFQINSGSEELYNPEYLMSKDIVLVTINYRLGIFGSFHLNTEPEYPGNLQMKDQVLALKWVQANIANFSGNPDSVTIFGESAGSASVHYHILSPMSTGLFYKAILESGNVFGPWVAGVEDNGLLLADVLEISSDNITAMMADLQNRTSAEILAAELNITANLNMKWARIGYPIIEKEYDQSDAFLTEDVLTVIESGEYNHVPMIIGYNDAEGISFLSSFEDINSMIPTDLNADDDTDKANEIIAKIQDFYFGDAEVPSNVAEAPSDVQEAIIKLYTDVYFSYPTYRMAMEHMKHVTEDESIYFYRFSADTKLNVYKLRNENIAGFAGATHADELGYLFKAFYHDNITGTVEANSVEDLAIERILTLWTNFAKYGNPTPDDFEDFTWSPITEDAFNYIDFGTNQTTTGTNPDPERIQFWEDIYSSGIISQPSLLIILSVGVILVKMNYFIN